MIKMMSLSLANEFIFFIYPQSLEMTWYAYFVKIIYLLLARGILFQNCFSFFVNPRSQDLPDRLQQNFRERERERERER